MTDTTPTPLFQRATHEFHLKDGTRVILQPLNPLEQEKVQGETSTARYAAQVAFYGLVDPKPESIDQVLEAGDRVFEICEELLYLSGMIQRPGDNEAADDGKGVDDPLVAEFPAAENKPVEVVDGSPAAVPGVREAVGGDPVSVDAGHAPDDGGGRESASGADASS